MLAPAQPPPLPCDLAQPRQAFHDGKRLLHSCLTIRILGVEHPDRGGFEGYGGAWHPPGEGDLRVEVLLQGGIPHRGSDRDGGHSVLLREGLRLAYEGLLSLASSLLRLKGNPPQAKLNRADQNFYSYLQRLSRHHCPHQSLASVVPPQGVSFKGDAQRGG